MKELEPIEILDDLNLFLNFLPSKIKKYIEVRKHELIALVTAYSYYHLFFTSKYN